MSKTLTTNEAIALLGLSPLDLRAIYGIILCVVSWFRYGHSGQGRAVQGTVWQCENWLDKLRYGLKREGIRTPFSFCFYSQGGTRTHS